jgi:hypothetical protein
VPRDGRGHRAALVPGAARWHVDRGLTSGSLVAGSRVMARGRWEGCVERGGKWRGSPRRSGVDGATGRDWRGGVPRAEGGRMVAGDAPRYTAVLRAGGRGEAAQMEGKEMGRREHDSSSHLREGTTSVARPSSRCGAALQWWGRSKKQQGGGFARGVLRSEDGGGGGREPRRGSGGRLPFERRQGKGEGRGNRAMRGGRRVTSRGPDLDRRGTARAARQRPDRGVGRH